MRFHDMQRSCEIHMPVSVSKVLVEQSQVHLIKYCLGLLSCYSGDLQSLKYLFSGLLQVCRFLLYLVGHASPIT